MDEINELVNDAVWFSDIVDEVQRTPFAFVQDLAIDVGFALLFWLGLRFLTLRWAQFTLRSINQREFWDDERKEAETSRVTLLRRYLLNLDYGLAALLFLGLFSLRFRIPGLQDVAGQVRDWLVGGGLGNLLSIVLVGVLIHLLLVVVRKTATALTPTGGQRFERNIARAATIRSVIESSAKIVLVTFFVLFAINALGIFDVTTLVAGVTVLGLAVSLGAQSLVKDVISGFFILAEDQFGVGDVVIVADLAGLVESVNLRITTLRDLEGRVHIIPNGQIDKVTVMTKDWSRSVLDIEVAYRTDLDRTIEVMREEGERLSKDREWGWRIVEVPDVLGVERFGSSGIAIRMLIKTLPREQWGVGREYRRRIKARFDREGIEIPFPHVTFYWGQGQKPGQSEALQDASRWQRELSAD